MFKRGMGHVLSEFNTAVKIDGREGVCTGMRGSLKMHQVGRELGRWL